MQARGGCRHFPRALLAEAANTTSLATVLDTAYHAASSGTPTGPTHRTDCRRTPAMVDMPPGLKHAKHSDFDEHAARAEDLNSRLYREVIAQLECGPSAHGTHGLPRLVRDMARLAQQGGELRHRRRPHRSRPRHFGETRIAAIAPRPQRGRSRLGITSARTSRKQAHRRDNYRGSRGTGPGCCSSRFPTTGPASTSRNCERRSSSRGLNTAEVVAKLTEAELLEFLFLPGFSTRASRDGILRPRVGLDVVQDTVTQSRWECPHHHR